MKKLFNLFLFIVFVLAMNTEELHATKKYWVAAVTGNWSATTPSNWATSSGGATLTTAPGVNDTAVFDGGGTGNCTIDVSINVKRVDISGAYSGTIAQGTNTVTIGAGGASLAGGTFNGGSAAITSSGSFTIGGTAFTSTSGILSCSAGFSLGSGSFTHNNGKVKFTATSTISGSTVFYKLEFAPASNSIYTLGSTTTLTVQDTLFFSGSSSTVLNAGNINAKGNIYSTNSFVAGGGGTTLITINGTGTQKFIGTSAGTRGVFPPIKINKSSSDTLKLFNSISVAGGWTYTAGIIDEGTSTVRFDGTQTITGTYTLNNVVFVGSSATYLISGTLTVKGVLTSTGGGTCPILNGGTINATGNIDLSVLTSTSGGGGTATLVINGTGNQLFTGSGSSSSARICGVTINKPSGTLTISDKLTVFGNWTYIAGTIDPTNSEIQFSGNRTISGTHTLHSLILSGFSAATYTIASGTTLTLTGGLTVNGTAAVTLNTGTINVQGDISYSNTSALTGGNASLVINGTGNQVFSGNGTAGTGKLVNATINKSSGTLTLEKIITVGKDWTYVAGTINPDTSLIYFTGAKTITGSHALNKVTFDGATATTYTIASGTILTVGNTLNTNGGAAVTLNTGTIYAKGDISLGNSSSSSGGSASLVINGTTNQYFSGNGTANTGACGNVTIDKPTGQLYLSSNITCSGDWLCTTGHVHGSYSSGGLVVFSTVAFTGTKNLDALDTAQHAIPFYDVIIYGGTRTLTGKLDVDHNLTIQPGSVTLAANGNDINVGATWKNLGGTWTPGSGTVTFDGSFYGQISKTSATETFGKIAFNKSAGSVTMAGPVKVNTSATLNKGHVKTTSTNYLEFADNATLSGGSDSAYIHGPVRKTGDDAFTFPLGDTTLTDSAAYHPLAMTAPSSGTDQFEATYFAMGQTVGDSLVDSLESVSACEYWTLDRKVGSSNVAAGISWNRNSCNINEYDDLRVGGWDGAKWIDFGSTALTINSGAGSLSTGASLNFSGHPVWVLTLAHKQNQQPYAILRRKLDAGYYSVTNGKLMFRFDEEYNDPDGKLTFNIYSGASYQLLLSNSMMPSALQPLVYYGDNRYLINVLDCNTFSSGVLGNGYFILEVINDKSEHWYLRFKHTTSITVPCTSTTGNPQ